MNIDKKKAAIGGGIILLIALVTGVILWRKNQSKKATVAENDTGKDSLPSTAPANEPDPSPAPPKDDDMSNFGGTEKIREKGFTKAAKHLAVAPTCPHSQTAFVGSEKDNGAAPAQAASNFPLALGIVDEKVKNVKAYLLRHQGYQSDIDNVFDEVLEDELQRAFKTSIVSKRLYKAMMQPPNHKPVKKISYGKYIKK